MLRKASEAVSEGNVPIPQQEEHGSGQPTLADAYRRIKLRASHFEEQTELLEKRLTRLEHGARQPRLAMEADGPANTKTHEGTDGAAIVVQAMRGDSCTAAQKVQDEPKTSITFGAEDEPPDLPCREDVLVEGGDAAPVSCLPSLEMHSPTAAGGLVPTGEASTATETTSNEPLLRFYATEEMNTEDDSKEKNSWTSVPSASYDSSSFWRLFAAPYCYRVVESKSRQNRTFDPGGSPGHLRACPFLGSWRALVCGEVIRAGELVTSCSVFSEEICWLFETRPVLMPQQEKVLPSRAARGYMNSREEQRSRRHDDSR